MPVVAFFNLNSLVKLARYFGSTMRGDGKSSDPSLIFGIFVANVFKVFSRSFVLNTNIPFPAENKIYLFDKTHLRRMTTLRAPRPMEFAVLFVEDTKERTTHEASCHCGAVQFEVTLKYVFPKYPINRCTCSICVKNGYMLVYPCRRDVVFTRGTFILS